MDAKEAITVAKAYVSNHFADEISTAPTLEEIWLDERDDAWCVTLGVRRETNHVERDLWRDPLGSKSRVVPDYKVVRISRKDGLVKSVMNREMVKTPA